ncbi:hypothetical protein QMZ05_02080 [Bradyrhizobium sp. INPA03-11B]|uniref:hypothetical protein n=1 Tax=Bradyrhizobium sp. INPA03-11B TaxID=418598 RepID=UPI00338F49F0
MLVTAMSLAESSSTPRNHLAHWMWGGCKQRPDLLALADPDLMKELDLRLHVFSEANGMVDCDGWDPEYLDPDFVLAYSLGDLNRAHRDLIAANEALNLVGSYLFADGVNPRRQKDPDGKIHMLARLNESPSFRTAKARTDAALQKHPPDPYAPLRSRWSR